MIELVNLVRAMVQIVQLEDTRPLEILTYKNKRIRFPNLDSAQAAVSLITNRLATNCYIIQTGEDNASETTYEIAVSGLREHPSKTGHLNGKRKKFQQAATLAAKTAGQWFSVEAQKRDQKIAERYADEQAEENKQDPQGEAELARRRLVNETPAGVA